MPPITHLFSSILRVRSLWLFALLFVLTEAAVQAQASSYRDPKVFLALEGERLEDEDDWSRFRLGESEDGTWHLVAQNMTVQAIGGSWFLLMGLQHQSGRQAVGQVLGTWASAIPLALLALVARAAMWPAYLSRQARALEQDFACPSLSKSVLRQLVAARLCANVLRGVALFAAVLPGIFVLWLGSRSSITFVSVAGLVVLVSGAAAGWLYPYLVFLFLEREVLLTETTQASLGRATAHRLRQALWSSHGKLGTRFAWAVAAWAMETVGVLGWLILVGPLTHAISRALADAWLTQRFLASRTS